ncbi:TPA: hypothetical protein ACT2TS_000092 [Citrobacter braakii]
MTFHVPTVAESTDRQLRDIQNALPDENADTSSDSTTPSGLMLYQAWRTISTPIRAGLFARFSLTPPRRSIWSLLDAALADLTSVGRDIISKNAIADILTYLGLHETGFAPLIERKTVQNISPRYIRFLATLFG